MTFEAKKSLNLISKLGCPNLNALKTVSNILISAPLLLGSTSMSFYRGPSGVLGIWGEWLFIFRELGSTGNYFLGFGEQAHSFGDLGSPAKK